LSSGSIPQKGDIAVWGNSNCGASGNYGHIGIVVGMNGNIKVSIAQANGYNGEIDVKDYPVDNPTIYLRYLP
jgi:surface antigen